QSCYGQTSNCITVTPSTCSATAAAPPSSVALATPAANQVRVTWTASPGAGSYKVSRKTGACAAPGTFTAVGVVASPGTSFLDASVEGTVTYSYVVASSDMSCAACTSAPSACHAV